MDSRNALSLFYRTTRACWGRQGFSCMFLGSWEKCLIMTFLYNTAWGKTLVSFLRKFFHVWVLPGDSLWGLEDSWNTVAINPQKLPAEQSSRGQLEVSTCSDLKAPLNRALFSILPAQLYFSNEKHFKTSKKNPEALTAGPPESAVTDPGWNFMKSE